jgi:site-specific recombinase XerD
MARVERKRKPEAAPRTAMELLMREHLESLRVRGYSEFTVKNRQVHIGFFIEWAYEHGLREPIEVTRPVLERYQRYLFFYRKKNGEPLTFRSQHARLVPLRVWFRWMTRQNHILHNPASEIDLPRLGRTLPKVILSIEEIEQVMAQPEIADAIGLRDRAILETIYATGLRRLEIVRLKLFDLQLDRGLILVNQGKGKKDRYVPIGERAAAWLRKYIAESRPQLAIEPDRPLRVPDDGRRAVQPRPSDLRGQGADRPGQNRQGRGLPLTAPLHGDAHARERSRHPFYPADPRTRGHQDHADLHTGRSPGLAAGLRGDSSDGVYRAGQCAVHARSAELTARRSSRPSTGGGARKGCGRGPRRDRRLALSEPRKRPASSPARVTRNSQESAPFSCVIYS